MCLSAPGLPARGPVATQCLVPSFYASSTKHHETTLEVSRLRNCVGELCSASQLIRISSLDMKIFVVGCAFLSTLVNSSTAVVSAAGPVTTVLEHGIFQLQTATTAKTLKPEPGIRSTVSVA